MRRGIGLVLVVGGLVAAFALGRAQAQESPEEKMKAWMDLGKPGPEHAEMKKMVGEWECTVKSWMAPNTPPVVSKGKSTFKMANGGLMLRQDFQGNMGGMPFTGVGYTAFNKATGKYEATWMDSMASGILFLNGTVKEKNKLIEYKCIQYGPGGQKIQLRYELSMVDDDTQLFKMWSNDGRGEHQALEMTYKRVKE